MTEIYRDNLRGILEFSGGKHLLSVGEVCKYTGLKNPRTVKHAFPAFQGAYISAESLARYLAGSRP